MQVRLRRAKLLFLGLLLMPIGAYGVFDSLHRGNPLLLGATSIVTAEGAAAFLCAFMEPSRRTLIILPVIFSVIALLLVVLITGAAPFPINPVILVALGLLVLASILFYREFTEAKRPH